MSWTRLILAGVRHHWRAHVGVLVGSAVAAAVLVGALLVGDSVRASLRAAALERIGRVDAALVAGDRFFEQGLAARLETAATRVAPDARVVPALQLSATASAGGGARRALDVAVYGVDAGFFELANGEYSGPLPGAGGVLLGERLAAQLEAKPGDEVLLRVQKPSALPRDMLLADAVDVSLGLRLEVRGSLGAAQLGRFGLRAQPVPPFNAFVDLAALQAELELEGRANLMLASTDGAALGLLQRLDAALREAFSLADGELAWERHGETLELVSSRVFLDDPVARALEELGAEHELLGVLTYFVNAVRHGPRATPYSVVSAVGPLGGGPDGSGGPGSPAGPGGGALRQVVPADLAADEIVVNEWLAEDLRAKAGDALELAYYVPGPDRRLTEVTRPFRVRSVVPIEGFAADPSLMPAFPGLDGAEHCRDWEPGMPIDLGALRREDEQYWEDHRGTPKAFLSLATGRELWANRFGSLTGVRVAAADQEALERALLARLDPAALGLYFFDVRTPALASSSSPTDFGGLFLALSFFLIASALLLTALLFAFGVEQRSVEMGTLLALGFRQRTVRRAMLAEGAVLAALGALFGAGLGIAYTQLVLRGLATVWRGAVGATQVEFHAAPATIAGGAGAALLAGVLSIFLVLRHLVRKSPLDLLAGKAGLAPARAARPVRGGRASGILALALAGAALVLGLSRDATLDAAGTFFGAGALLLAGGLAGTRWLLARLSGSGGSVARSVAALGVRNGTRRPARSVATVSLLACGSFLVLSIGVHHRSAVDEPHTRSSGTGGFALFGRSTLPLAHDLATSEGREALGFREADLGGVGVVSMRVRDGDDASCLTLNAPQKPRLVGVDPAQLAERGAFSFVASEREVQGSPWELLRGTTPDGAVPAVVDHASATWVLKKKVGDAIEYQDERGRPFHVRIVATVASSILQGLVVVSQEAFQQRFPSASGFRMFLVDAPPAEAAAVAEELTRALSEVGLELTPAAQKLDEFNAVQNTYLKIFQLLGGLGVLLGSVGLGVVVLRNALERRGELAVVRAIGFRAGDVRRLLWSEHGLMLVLGLAVGCAAALLALAPVTRAAPVDAPLRGALPLALAMALNGAFWIGVASLAAVRGPLLEALRNE